LASAGEAPRVWLVVAAPKGLPEDEGAALAYGFSGVAVL
jgi:hypothetical protein